MEGGGYTDPGVGSDFDHEPRHRTERIILATSGKNPGTFSLAGAPKGLRSPHSSRSPRVRIHTSADVPGVPPGENDKRPSPILGHRLLPLRWFPRRLCRGAPLTPHRNLAPCPPPPPWTPASNTPLRPPTAR